MTPRARSTLRPSTIVAAAWILPAVLAGVNHFVQAKLHDDSVNVAELLFSSGDWFLYAFLTPGVFALSRRFPLARPLTWRSGLLHFGFALLFCVAWATLGKLFQLSLALVFRPDQVRAVIADGTFWNRFGLDWFGWVFTTLPFGVAVYLCMVGIEHSIRYFIEARDRELQVARLSEQLAGAQFAALQAQVNPHFLFNTLNTITVHVRDDDRRGAVRIIEHLSEMLRRTLSPNRANEVTLGEELHLVGEYVAIEQARFTDRLRPEMSIDADTTAAVVPSFAVQHLVENAIRHGIAKAPDAGRLLVRSRRIDGMLEVVVEDDGVGIDSSAATPTGHGIANTRDRLRAMYGDAASLVITRREGGGTVATLRVPYRTQAHVTR